MPRSSVGVMEPDVGRWALPAHRPADAEVLCPVLVPNHVFGLHAELVLELTARPHGPGLAVVGIADPHPSQVFRSLDARCPAHNGSGVGKISVIKHGQHQVRKSPSSTHHEERERHLRKIELLELELPIEEVGAPSRRVLKRDAIWFNLTGYQRHEPIIRRATEGQHKVIANSAFAVPLDEGHRVEFNTGVYKHLPAFRASFE